MTHNELSPAALGYDAKHHGSIDKENKGTLNSANTCYHSTQNIFMLHKNVSIKCKKLKFFLLLYRSETWSDDRTRNCSECKA